MRTFVIIVLMFSLPRLHAQEPEGYGWESGWENGSWIHSDDQRFKVIFGGRIYYDAVATITWDDSLSSYAGPSGDGAFPRTVRFFNSGRIYGNINYKLGIDFSGGIASLKCACVRMDQIPWLGRVSLGHFKEPFGLEELTSANYITFMERSLVSPFTPSRNFGLMINNQAFNNRFTWAAGAFRDTDSQGMAIGHWESSLSFTGRVTVLPWISEENNNLLHLGLAFRKSLHDSLRYRSSPGVRLQPDFVDTQYMGQVWGINLSSAELAAIWGPFSLQGEYMIALINRDIADTTTGFTKGVENHFSAFYVQAGVFLTPGDQKAYSGSSATFDRVRPGNNFDLNGGWGALELAVRYSRLDLVDGESLVTDRGFVGSSLIPGGVVDNITIGVNWYLNPVTRIMVNYTHASLANAGGHMNPDEIAAIGAAGFLQTRFQVDF